jgi:hypothetical protein
LTVPADDVELGIDQHRNIEAEGLDAVRDLPDLLLTVNPRISGIRFEFFGRPKIDPVGAVVLVLMGSCLYGFIGSLWNARNDSCAHPYHGRANRFDFTKPKKF